MSTLNKYAAAARCIRRQRILKKNAAAYIKLAAEGDGVVPKGGYNAGVPKTSRPATPKPGNLPPANPKNPMELPEFAARLALDKMGPGHSLISKDNMMSIADSIDYAVGAFLRDQRDPNFHWRMAEMRRAHDIPGYTFKQRAADAERYAPATAEEIERRRRRDDDGYTVPYMLGDMDNSEAASSYDKYERMIDYEGLNTPQYVPGADFLRPDVDYLPVTYRPSVKPSWGTEAIQAHEAAELEAFKKRYPEYFREPTGRD